MEGNTLLVKNVMVLNLYHLVCLVSSRGVLQNVQKATGNVFAFPVFFSRSEFFILELPLRGRSLVLSIEEKR